MSRTDQFGVTHLTADDPITAEGNAHLASCPQCRRAFPYAMPKRRRFNPWALLWIPAVLIVVSFMGLVLMNQPATVGAAVPSPSVKASAPGSSAAAHVPVVIYQRSGSGEFTSDYFTTPSEWNVQWSYDCGTAPGSSDAFFAVSSDDMLKGLNADHTGPNGADTSWVHDDAGRHYLQVFSGCPWTVKVIG